MRRRRSMDTIHHHFTRRMAHNSSPSSSDVMKYSPTDSLKMNNRDNKRIERRKPNWTESENVFLLDQFAMHREILTCKATDASTNLRKQEIWRLICANLNQNNTLVRRTPAEVRRKWKNLVTAAKKEVWEMRHQIHISGGSGTNGRKISELSQRVLQLHSSGNINNQSNGIYGSLLSAGLLGNASGSGGAGDKFASKYADYMEDKGFIPAHFTPIITLSESNNNHIITGNHGDGPPSPMMSDDDDEDQESSDSRNATEFMSDSGVNDQEGMDLRVNVSMGSGMMVTRNSGSYSSNSNSRSGRISHVSSVGGGGGGAVHLLQNHHHRDSLMARSLAAAADLGDEDDDLLEDDEEVELAIAAEKRYANYNGQLTNGGTITKRENQHGGQHHSALANFHHSATNGPGAAAAAAAAASVLLERQHLQHLQQLATAASLRPALNTGSNSNSSSSAHNNISSNNNTHNNNSHTGQNSEESTNLNRKCSESTEEISHNGGGAAVVGGSVSGGGGGTGGDILFNTIRNANNVNTATNFLKFKNHFAAALQESDLLSNLYKERLQLQIEVLKLRKEKLSQELSTSGNSKNGIMKPRVVRCGWRLHQHLRGKNNYRNNHLYRAKLALSRFRALKENSNISNSNGIGDPISNGIGGLDPGPINHDNCEEEDEEMEVKMNIQVNGNIDGQDEDEEEADNEGVESLKVPTVTSKKLEAAIKKESEGKGKSLVNGDCIEGSKAEIEECSA